MEQLHGTVERITFTSEESGYSVIKVSNQNSLVTVVGYFPKILKGEDYQFQGGWKEHAKFGRQFQAASFEHQVPSSLEGIERYLASGVIKGVGPKTAKRIVEKFGLQTLDILREEPKKLQKISGVGKKSLEKIISSLQSFKKLEKLTLFLSEYHLGFHWAQKLFKVFGEDAVSVLKEKPF